MTVLQDSQVLSPPRGGDNGFMDSEDDGGQARPRRRTFSAEYKLAILEAYDGLDAPGAKGALLRREGLFVASDRVAQGPRCWRAQRPGPPGPPRGEDRRAG